MRIFNRTWWPLQPRTIVMAPDGNIWCHPRGRTWRADWSAGPLAEQAFFLHEMTHVWQWQSGICVWLARPPFARYRYTLQPGKPLHAYGLEQQAEIIRHAWLARQDTSSNPLWVAADQLVRVSFA